MGQKLLRSYSPSGMSFFILIFEREVTWNLSPFHETDQLRSNIVFKTQGNISCMSSQQKDAFLNHKNGSKAGILRLFFMTTRSESQLDSRHDKKYFSRWKNFFHNVTCLEINIFMITTFSLRL